MYRNLSVIAIAPVLDEERKIVEVVRRVPKKVVDETLVVDDGSTDGSAGAARSHGATVISLTRTEGVGAAIRAGYAYAIAHGYDVAIVMAGNNKDSPEEIPSLLDPIADGAADFVQGSRFLSKGAGFGAMPIYRRIATRMHPILFSMAARRRVTESTNGFRAVTTRVLRDSRLRLDQRWLDGYELEPYLYLRTIKLGYRTAEVPVTKVYPPRHMGQTKMRAGKDWWAIMKPVMYELFRIGRARRDGGGP